MLFVLAVSVIMLANGSLPTFMVELYAPNTVACFRLHCLFPPGCHKGASLDPFYLASSLRSYSNFFLVTRQWLMQMTLHSSVLATQLFLSNKVCKLVLDFVHEWSLSHQLFINVSKCFALCMSGTRITCSGNLPLYIDGRPISVVDKLKILGVFCSRFKMAFTSL